MHVKHEGLQFSVQVTYSATYATQLAGALHGISAGYASIPSLPLGGSASAQEIAGAYVDIYVLMDVSSSIAIIADWGPWNQANVAQSIAIFGEYVGRAGDGSSAATACKYVFILTDGMEDFMGKNGQRVVVPFDPKVCQGLKDKGVVILILQTTNDDPTDQIGENGLLVQVRPLLQQCASGPDLFTAASTPAEINAAIRNMVNYAISTPAQFTQ